RLTAIEALLEPAKPQTDGKKGTAALDPLQGRWRILSIDEGIDDAKGNTATAVWKNDAGEIEISGTTLWMPYRESGGNRRREEFRIVVDADANPKTIDLIASGKPVGKGIYEFIAPSTTCASCHTGPVGTFKPPIPDLIGLCVPGFKASHQQAGAKVRLAFATAGPRPTKFAGGAEGVIEFVLERVADVKDDRAALSREAARLETFLKGAGTTDERNAAALRLAELRVEEARQEEKAARARVDRAYAQLVEENMALTLVFRKLQAAQEKLDEAEKAIAKDGKAPPAPAKAGDSFTVHVRPLAAAEKVIRVNATGNETVLEGLAYAAEDMAIKPDVLTVWVVRGGDVMPVDLAGILQKGETGTNYVLKPGDQLFVQVKVGK
ncbi:MAG TPA: hypothetical protein VM529_15335, partial [Gemmata sp.]|nr:hypothetical protein [Gemmata sp.]